MLEQELQDFVEDLVNRGQLVTATTGWEDVRAIAADQHRNGESLLLLDDLVLHRAAEAALMVEGRLGTLTPVADSRASISLNRKEALFTDLLYISPSTGTVVVFELKRNRKVARETATELLAYEQELRNHLHFAARTDICFVVVSTDYSPLLDHSLLSLTAWHGLRILCLKAGPDKSLSVHIPEAWSSLGQSLISPQYIETMTLTFTPHDAEMAAEKVGTLVSGAMDIIARNSDRNGATGFGIVWEDTRYLVETRNPVGLTVARVNPAGFLADTRAGNFLGDVPRSPLHRKITGSFSGNGWHPTSPEIEDATRYLAHHGVAEWERTPSWEDLRSDHRHRRRARMLDDYAVPVICSTWGLVGDYVRDLLTAPERSSIPLEFRNHVIDTRTPEFTLRVLDTVAAEDRTPTFGAHWLCSFGFRLARLWIYVTIYPELQTLRARERARACLSWARIDLGEPMGAVQSLSLPGTPPPPPMIFGADGDGAPMEDPGAIAAFIKWFGEHAITDRNPLHRAIFDGAASDAQALDSALTEMLPTIDLKDEIAAARGRAATTLMRAVMDAPSRPYASEALTAHLASCFSLACTATTSSDDLMRMIDQIPTPVLLDEYTRAVPQALDIAVAPPHLDRGRTPYVFTNGMLSIFRRRVLKQRALGNNPGLYIRNNGECGLVLLSPNIVGPFGPLTDEDVLLEYSPTANTLLHELTTWDALRRRKLFL
ncbi:hypothetical protein [Nocardia sp. MDA0666]|uniref:hypothetical protein n=1 Tax=Nocardia sp. MDA0666 TaxID=2135448 RepID=UPI0011B23762|nr:hypothetical protein [Nocardia sp. MDA0666]